MDGAPECTDDMLVEAARLGDGDGVSLGGLDACPSAIVAMGVPVWLGVCSTSMCEVTGAPRGSDGLEGLAAFGGGGGGASSIAAAGSVEEVVARAVSAGRS